jgi:hypothetical protein
MSVAVGNDSGEFFVSDDKGENWSGGKATGGSDDVFVAFDADFADNGMMYFATESSLVGSAKVSGTSVSSIGELEDSNSEANNGTTFNAIVCAPDNALYVAGSTGEVETYLATDVTGTMSFTGLMSGATVAAVDLTSGWVDVSAVTVISGSFEDAETLNIIAADVYAESSSIITGIVYVEGDTSGAAGSFEITVYGVGTVVWAAGGDVTLGEDMMAFIGDEAGL